MEEYRPHLKDRLRRAFVKASEQEIMRRVRAPEQLTRLREIEERAQLRMHRAERLFRQVYDARVSREMRRIMNERASFKRELRFMRIGSDVFDQLSLRHAGERAARRRQEQLMARIRQAADREKRAVVGLPERTRHRAPPERLRQVFERARERS